MKYCTNCGKECSGKICPSCGVKNNTSHKYCGWCGSDVHENAVICTKCNERIKQSGASKFFGIVTLLFAVVLFALGIGSALDGAFVSTILYWLGGILLLPFIGGIIRNATFHQPGKRKAFQTVRIILIVVLFVGGLVTMAAPDPFEIYTEDATAAAEVVFHEEVKLKNEASFVINESKVTYFNDAYKNNEDLRLVTVVIDYSAQNSMGGMTRDSYTVKILFNVKNGNYYRLDGSLIQT